MYLALGPIYGPDLNNRCRAHLKRTNKSYRVDETYIRIKGQDQYLYRAVDSTWQTIDFLLTAKRDAAAAKRLFRKMLLDPANPQPRVINVDKNRAYPAAVDGLKVEGTLRRRCRLRQCKYLNNVVEQDHRVSFSSAWRTLLGLVAEQIGLAIDAAVNFYRSERAQDQLKLILDLTNQVVSNLEFDDLLHATSASVRKVMQCDRRAGQWQRRDWLAGTREADYRDEIVRIRNTPAA